MHHSVNKTFLYPLFLKICIDIKLIDTNCTLLVKIVHKKLNSTMNLKAHCLLESKIRNTLFIQG